MQLFYVSGNFAYFSNLAPAYLRGEDWDDVPYQDNALPVPTNRGPIQCHVATLVFDHPRCTVASERGDFSVLYLNKGYAPWLVLNEESFDIYMYAGMHIDKFKDVIKQWGGKVYVEDA